MIYKYPLMREQECYVITMPFKAKVLSFQVQRGVPCIWAKIDLHLDSQYNSVKRYFFLLGIGDLFPKIGRLDTSCYLEFVGTIQVMGGSLVFHLFEFPYDGIVDLNKIDDQIDVWAALDHMAKTSTPWPGASMESSS